jgi:lipid A 3-O-deacylase
MEFQEFFPCACWAGTSESFFSHLVKTHPPEMFCLKPKSAITSALKLAAAVMIATSSLSLHGAGTSRIVFENDAFGGSDRYFTNGVRLDWMPPSNVIPPTVRQWAKRTGFHLPGSLGDTSSESQITYTLGQNMYTAADIRDPNPPLDDRPYAGWLHLGVVLSRRFAENERGPFLIADAIQFDFGVTGPASLAERTQKWVHRDIRPDAPTPEGWGTQMPAEPTIDVMYERRWRVWHTKRTTLLDADIYPSAAIHVGTLFDQIRVGGTFRFGVNLPEAPGSTQQYPSNLIQSVKMRPPPRGVGIKASPELTTGLQPFRLFFIGGFNAKGVARNGFLDGPLFRNGGRSVSKEPLVIETFTGFSTAFRRFELTYLLITRSAEFKTQVGTQTYGSLQLGYQW